MKPAASILVAWIALCAPLLSAAAADCTAAPEPGVDWRRCVQDRQVLAGVDLTGATLRDGSFKRTDLGGAVLADVDARGAKLLSATMTGARLDGADLARADLTRADLSRASLKKVNL